MYRIQNSIIAIVLTAVMIVYYYIIYIYYIVRHRLYMISFSISIPTIRIFIIFVRAANELENINLFETGRVNKKANKGIIKIKRHS